MKLAVSTYSLVKWRRAENKTLEDTIDLVADLGAHGIEFSGLDEGGVDDPIQRARQLRKRVEKKGLDMAGYCIGAELLLPPKKQREAIEQVKQQVDVAAAIGASNMRHDITRGWDGYKNFKGKQTFAAALKVIVPAIREIADYAAEQGVKTSLENHGFYMQAAQRIQKLQDAVDHENFGLTIDLGNFLCVNDDPVEALKRLHGYMIHAHVKDFHVRPKNTIPPSGWMQTPTRIALRGAIVGHGDIDVIQQLKLLKKYKYTGHLSLEFEGMEDPPFAVEQGLLFVRTELEKINALDK